MPRKSLAKERRQQILDAFERCISKQGLEATTLEQVADEADMTRSIIRHYIGNRDELVEALVDRRLKESTDDLIQQYAGLSPQDSVQLTLANMFPETKEFDERDRIFLEVMTVNKDLYPVARKKLKTAFEALIKSFADDLKRVYRNASRQQCDQVAYAIICISEMNETFMGIGVNQRYNTSAQQIADTLLKTLE